jgi:hypothetical protein
VMINKQPCKEYLDEDEGEAGAGDRKVVKYIEAIPGAEFQFRISSESNSLGLQKRHVVRITGYVDGQPLRSRIWTKEKTHGRHESWYRGACSSIDGETWLRQPLQFDYLKIGM